MPIKTLKRFSFWVVLNWWHIALGSSLMVGTGALVFMWFDTTPPFEFDASQSRVIPEVARSGTQIRVDWKVKVHRLCPGSNVRELFDPVTKARLAYYDPVSTASDAALEGNDDHLIRTFLLPKRISPGPVGYRAHLTYRCNWLQRFFPLQITTPDLFFTLENEN